MNFFNSRNDYQLIEPVPRRGQRKTLHYFLIGIGIVIIGTIGAMIFLNMSSYYSSEQNPIDIEDVTKEPSNIGNDTSEDSTYLPTVLEHRLKLGAAAPGEETPREDVLVTLDAGELRGTYLKSRGGRDVLAFLGIPYAEPPVGDLRFQLPVEAEPWEGTYNATGVKPDCIQKDKYIPEFVTIGSEDCLYLNVYTPKNLTELNGRRNRFPVMFYVHGGGQFGSGTKYHSDYFMDENIVLVTIHYRLGVLGNLNTNDTEARGNQGLKDQIMALQWVKNNIRKFGGDNKKITIFGNSYGSIQITAHLLSPMSKGLFHRVIAQSGTTLMPGMFPENPVEVAYALSEKMNCTNSNKTSDVSDSENNLTTKELVTCLKNIDSKTLILSSYLMDFQLSVEPPVDDDNVFLADSPINLIQAGNLNPVPAIFGTTSGEGLVTTLAILSSENTTRYFNEEWETAATGALELKQASDPAKIANAAKEFYFGGQNISRDNQANFTDMVSDRSFVHPAQVFATAQLAVASRRQNIFLYYFNKDADKTYAQPGLDLYTNDTSIYLGAGHADELQFLFPYEPYPLIPEGHKNANFSRMLVRLWATFADTGKPTGVDNGAEWEPISNPKPFRWFLIQDEPAMVDFLGPRMNFWDQFNLTDLYHMKDGSPAFNSEITDMFQEPQFKLNSTNLEE